MLADFCNNKTGLCCPSIQLMAEETALAQSTVKRGIKELKDNGFIKVIPITPEPDPKDPDKKLYAHNTYKLQPMMSPSSNKISKPSLTTGPSFDVIDNEDKPGLTTGPSFDVIDNEDKPSPKIRPSFDNIDRNQVSPQAPIILSPSATYIIPIEEGQKIYIGDEEYAEVSAVDNTKVSAVDNTKVSAVDNTVTTHNYLNTLIDSKIEDEVVESSSGMSEEEYLEYQNDPRWDELDNTVHKEVEVDDVRRTDVVQPMQGEAIWDLIYDNVGE